MNFESKMAQKRTPPVTVAFDDTKWALWYMRDEHNAIVANPSDSELYAAFVSANPDYVIIT